MPSHMGSADLLLDGSGDSALLSPHLPSPALHETTSPIFPSSSFSPVTAYRTPSIDLHRRSSLHTVESSHMSEPDLFRRSSLDHQKMAPLFYHQETSGGYTSPLVHSPTPLLPGGSAQVGSVVGRGVPPDPVQLGSSQSLLQAVERSKSLENISPQMLPSHPFKRRMSAQVPLATNLPSKRPRFEMVPHSIRGASPEPPLPSSLQRSMSLSALSRNSHHPFSLGGRGHHSTSGNHDDELDMIKEIIDRDDTLVGHPHQHFLIGVPAELSVSLPVLYPSESLQVLHTYNSAPVIARPTSSASPGPSTSQNETPPTSSTEPLLPPGLISGLNGAISELLTDSLPPHKDIGFSSDLCPFTSPPTSANPYSHTQSSSSAPCPPSDPAYSSSNLEHKLSLASFNLITTGHPHSPILSDMLQATPDSAPSSLLRSALSTPVYPTPTSSSSSAQVGGDRAESAQVATEAEVLCRRRGISEGVKVVDVGRGESVSEGGELDIAVVVNQHASVSDPTDISPEEGSSRRESAGGDKEASGGERGKPSRSKVTKEMKGGAKRGRGRPRLTEEEKQRRKELRELGLMKRSHRRTKEEVAQWRADRILSPAKRGRKPGSGKKNVVKAVTGKEVYVSVDLSKYDPGTVLLQNGFCRAFPGMPRCMECGNCEGDLPLNRYCRFLEFRKICVVETAEPKLQVEGFATYTDVQASDMVPWTPLKAGYSHMDSESALFILRRVAPQFLGVVSSEAATLPEGEVTPVWKRAVQGLREMCDTCDTAIFNFHWICPHCGFCVCPACYQMAWDLEEGYDMPSATHKGWPTCTAASAPHLPSSLIVAQIIPADVLANVLLRMLKICEAHHMRQEVPRPLQQLINLISRHTPQSRFQNSRKGKGAKSRCGRSNVDPGGGDTSLTSPLEPSPLDTSPCPPLPPSSSSSSCCPNGREEVAFPTNVPHSWLCNNTLLCLHDPGQPENMAAFQHQWRRGRPVVVQGVHRRLAREMWTPQAFGRDFGEDYSELVDCQQSFPLPHYPSRVFWDGFEDLGKRLRDPASGEPRLLKQKDWPPGEDFSEKLPKRFEDLMSALPLPHYTRRDGKLNIASSLPDFFVKPDMGPKMYNAYGSPAHPSCGTTNLHLDISDATNVMVYCSVPAGAEEEEEMIRETVKEECCEQTYRRCSSSSSSSLRVGALWHIYASSDTDSIRSFLRKVFEERGIKQAAGSDPIHDQLIYLDSDLRQRLEDEHGVRGWSIAQAVGDAIFIPAGAPHQVRNLCSCIKVAEDFVSPEHVQECVKLTEEFRLLSDGHVNHEDKLQVKNIMYHSVKDIVGILSTTPPN